ncbi:hypothetical protein DRQ18_03740 [bacterium]|nr:MAG: hypothetical protein DRQ18_03740 [bacterium]
MGGIEALLREEFKKEGFNWKCLGERCPCNCCAGFDNSLYSSITYLPNGSIPLTEKDVERMKDVLEIYTVQDKYGFYYMKMDENGRCCALDENGKCKIYEIRPTSCRAYPFFVDKYAMLAIDKKCPGVGKGMTEWEEIEEMIKAAIEVYEFVLKKIKIIMLKEEVKNA